MSRVYRHFGLMIFLITLLELLFYSTDLLSPCSEEAYYVHVNEAEAGVDPIYLEILKDAERKSALDFENSHNLGDKGVVIGPTEGDFRRHTLRALRNAKRIRNILAGDRSIKLALMTSSHHIALLNQCRIHASRVNTKPRYREACRLWGNGTLFDHVIETKNDEYTANDNHTRLKQGSSQYWLKALGGYRYAPYTTSFFLDSDAYPCPGFEKLFELVSGRSKIWQLPTMQRVDFAAGIDQYPDGTGNEDLWIPGNRTILKDFQFFPERNTGVVLFHFQSQLAHTFAHFLPLVAEHVYNNVATRKTPVVNDQCPFRIALYLFGRLRPDFVHQQIPMHASCRSYPGKPFAGTDGFLNGMFPIQQDGTRCDQCHCTPCLITHLAGTHTAYIEGRHGWEDDRFFNNTGQIEKAVLA